MAKKKAVKKTAIKKGSAAAKAKMARVRAGKTKRINELKKAQLKKTKSYQRKVKLTNSGGYLWPYNVAKDEALKAMPPGKRISKKTGEPYWEYRVNRSDMPGSLTGAISGIKLDFANELTKYVKVLEEKQKFLQHAKNNIKRKNSVIANKEMVKIFNTQIRSLKTHINQLKRKI
jgi:hypothetical protein